MKATELRAITDKVHARAEESKQAAAVKFWNEVAMPQMTERAKAGRSFIMLTKPEEVTDNGFMFRVCEIAKAEGYSTKTYLNGTEIGW